MRKRLGSRFIGVMLCAALLIAMSAQVGAAPLWRQAAADGFGDAANTGVRALAELITLIYAGTANESGAQVWISPNGRHWLPFTPTWSAETLSVLAAQTFHNKLYIGTYRESGGEIWRTDGLTWTLSASEGLGNSRNAGFDAFSVFGDRLYVATTNPTSGVEIWRSSTGNQGTWQRVSSNGFGRGRTGWDVVMEVFGNRLYVGLGRTDGRAELWRSQDGTAWEPIFTDGLGYAGNWYVCATAVFRGMLYLATRNTVSGGQIWRSSNGSNWTPVTLDGLGDTKNGRPYGLIVHDDALYAVFSNLSSGVQVWRSTDGMHWEQLVSDGWGSGNYFGDYYDKAALVFRGALYIGTDNEEAGAQIWQLVPSRHLPLLTKG